MNLELVNERMARVTGYEKPVVFGEERFEGGKAVFRGLGGVISVVYGFWSAGGGEECVGGLLAGALGSLYATA